MSFLFFDPSDVATVRRGSVLEGLRLEFRTEEDFEGVPVMNAYVSVVIEDGKPPTRVFLASLGLPLVNDKPDIVASFRTLCADAMNAWVAQVFAVDRSEISNVAVEPGKKIEEPRA